MVKRKMVKYAKKGFIGLILFLIIFSMYTSIFALAGEGGTKNIAVNQNHVRNTVKANVKTAFRFQEKTQVSIESDVDVDANIKCDANEIGNKNFELEINGDKKFSMTMTCKMEETQLGLMNGSTVRARHINRYIYKEGFVASIESSEQVSALLKIQANNNNAGGTWAYYDEATEEWVPVATSLQDGYLVCQTDHFSTWTILVPEIDIALILIVGLLSVIALIAIVVIIKKR
ncbi:MAG: hypothetical protein ACTSUT_21120 [Promethearchaeota archaeon]